MPDELLFAAQREVKHDPARLATVDGPRRIGKSKFAAVALLDVALTVPRAKCLFLALTLDDARDIVWAELKELNEDYALGGIPNEIRLELVFPLNGSRIRLGGAKDRTQAERRRGRFYDLVIIDECQSFPSHIRDLVESILKPSLLGKGRRGRIVLMGTPGEIPGVGYWEECVADRGLWSYHTWDTYDNIWLGTKEEIDAFLAEMAHSMRDEGGAESPRFLREFRGKRVPPRNIDRPYIYEVTKQDFNAEIVERIDTKALRFARWALPFDPKVYNWQFVFGIDLGHVDASAICVWGVCDAAPGIVWLVEEFISVKMLPDTLWAKINERRAIYNPVQMAVDEGALGKMIAEQWRAPPYNLPVVGADKLAPEVQADFLSGAMSRGAVKISKFSSMAGDMAVARWDGDKLKLGKRVEAKTPHSDIIPAGRYGFKKAHSLAISLQPRAAPPPTADEAEAAEVQRERDEGARRARALMEGGEFRPERSARRDAIARMRR
jgi:hypothetical protein